MIVPENQTFRRFHARQRHNAEFVRSMLRRKPDLDLARLRAAALDGLPEKLRAEGVMRAAPANDHAATFERSMVLETIVARERPVMFVQGDWLNTTEVTAFGDEAAELIEAATSQRSVIGPMLPLIGRIDVTHFPGNDWVGTGWLVAPDVVVTNRHVASLVARWDGRRFAFRLGIGGNQIRSTLDTLHEFDDVSLDEHRRFAITEVLYIEPQNGPYDIAFMRVARRTDGSRPNYIPVASADLPPDTRVLVVGYPARATKDVIPDQDLMRELFRGRYDVKRAAPGYTMLAQRGSARHDCTTLGGNSGSVVLDIATGHAVGLHYAGLYQEANYAVPAVVLSEYVTRKRWNRPPEIQPDSVPAEAASDSTAIVTIPFTITVSLGSVTASVQPAGGSTAAGEPRTSGGNPVLAEAAVRAFWEVRPAGVVAVRVGYPGEGDRFGNQPFIAASISPDQAEGATAALPGTFQAFEVRYFATSVWELIESTGTLEAPSRVAYDDEARIGEAYSFEPVEESMTVEAHVGPEYSWEVLKRFLGKTGVSLVSAMYEFHAPHILDAFEERLQSGTSVDLVIDGATFHGADADQRTQRFQHWADQYEFERVVAPEGANGLILNAYHTKVTVRSDDVFWLSSGNFKDGSSQPIVTQQQRDDADIRDIAGNREWHVVVRNPTLARRFRNHIQRDLARSRELGGGPIPNQDEAVAMWVDVPVMATIEPERPPPGRVVKPKKFTGVRRVKPLMTPDRRGEIYSEAVLELVRSAKTSLLFQIPYIGMPPNPRARRGYIDELINALTLKLKTLDDARVILRTGSSRFSSPTHAAWYFKSKGVDIENRLRVIENHHTKGMIVDGTRVLIGSHNWSQPGVSLNRDASLLFDDKEIAEYYAEAFEIDWTRSRAIRPERFATEGAAALGVSLEAPLRGGYRRVRLADLIKEEE